MCASIFIFLRAPTDRQTHTHPLTHISFYLMLAALAVRSADKSLRFDTRDPNHFTVRNFFDVFIHAN